MGSTGQAFSLATGGHTGGGLDRGRVRHRVHDVASTTGLCCGGAYLFSPAVGDLGQPTSTLQQLPERAADDVEIRSNNGVIQQ